MRLRDQPHFLRAPRHVREHVEEHDRRQVDRAEHRQHRRRQAGRAERRLQFGQIEPAEQEAADHPDAGEDAGENVGGLAPAGAVACAGCVPIDSRSSLAAGRRMRAGVLRPADFVVVVVDAALDAPRASAGPATALRHGSGRPGRAGPTARARPAPAPVGIPHLKRILDRRQRRLRRVLHLLRGVSHGRSSPRCYAGPGPRPERFRPRHERVSLEIPSGSPGSLAAGLKNVPQRHPTAARVSYRLGRPKETAW